MAAKQYLLVVHRARLVTFGPPMLKPGLGELLHGGEPLGGLARAGALAQHVMQSADADLAGGGLGGRPPCLAALAVDRPVLHRHLKVVLVVLAVCGLALVDLHLGCFDRLHGDLSFRVAQSPARGCA